MVEVLLFFNHFYPTIRFSANWANSLMYVLFFLAPLVVLITWIRLRPRQPRLTLSRFFATTAFSLLAASWMLIGYLLLIMEGEYAFKEYLECEDLPVSAHTVVHAFAYPGWGPVREGYVISHEMTIFPGVRLVKVIERGYLDNETTFCEDMRAAIAKRTDLKPYVYF